MEFDSTSNKIEKTFNKEEQNASDIKDLKRVDVFSFPNATKKRIVTLSLIANYDFQNGTGGTVSPFVEFISGEGSPGS